MLATGLTQEDLAGTEARPRPDLDQVVVAIETNLAVTELTPLPDDQAIVAPAQLDGHLLQQALGTDRQDQLVTGPDPPTILVHQIAQEQIQTFQHEDLSSLLIGRRPTRQ
ncbi:hypothetical protein D3C78_1504090 [compost metagenome]